MKHLAEWRNFTKPKELFKDYSHWEYIPEIWAAVTMRASSTTGKTLYTLMKKSCFNRLEYDMRGAVEEHTLTGQRKAASFSILPGDSCIADSLSVPKDLASKLGWEVMFI